MIDYTELQNDLLEVISELPTMVTINGTVYSASLGTIDEQYELTVGGDYEVTNEFQLIINKSAFSGSYPQQRTPVYIDNRKYYLTNNGNTAPNMPMIVYTVGKFK